MVVGFSTETTDTILFADNKLVRRTLLATRIGNSSGLFGRVLWEDEDVGFRYGLDMGSDIANGSVESFLFHIGPVIHRTETCDERDNRG